MYKKVVLVFISIVLILFSIFPSYAVDSSDISASSAVVMIADTGEVVYEKNAYDKLSMASTTKIMSAVVALESGRSEQLLKISSDMVMTEGTSLGLLPDDIVSVYTLVCGMLLESGNDAANSVAYAVAGSVDNFVMRMNKKAKEIGMNATNFVTVSGLDSDEHYSTAYDMALLGSYAIKNPEFRNICSKKEMTVSFGNPPFKRKITNHNRLLSSCDGVFGIKTGFTKKSGRCLVSAAERDGVTLVAVTLKAPNDWNDHEKLYNLGFSAVKKQSYIEDMSSVRLKVIGSDKNDIEVKQQYDFVYSYLNSSKTLKTNMFIEQFEYSPIKKGDIVGKICYSIDNKVLAEIPIIANEDANCITKEDTTKKPKSFFENIKEKIVKVFKR